MQSHCVEAGGGEVDCGIAVLIRKLMVTRVDRLDWRFDEDNGEPVLNIQRTLDPDGG
jgi:hypothetical protein